MKTQDWILATVTVNDNANQTFSGVSGGTGADEDIVALAKTENNVLTLSGSNRFTGAATISSGAINIHHANALGATTGSTTVASGAQLQIQGGVMTAAEPISVSGTGRKRFVAESGCDEPAGPGSCWPGWRPG